MASFKDGLRMRQLEQRLQDQAKEIGQAQRDRQVLAENLCRSAEFLDWLMDQDFSSSLEAYVKREPGKRFDVENADDLDLALAYCRRAQR